MTRCLLNFLTALSLLTCVAMVALWGRSYRTADWIECGRPAGHVQSWRGWMILCRYDNIAPPAATDPLSRQRFRYETYPPAVYAEAWERVMSLGPRRRWPTLGVFTVRLATGRLVFVPHAALCAASLVAPARAARRAWCRRRRKQSGRCPACGYDLRASPARCPECGTTTATVSTTP